MTMDHHYKLTYIKSSQDCDYLLYSRKKIIPASFIYGRKNKKDKVDRKIFVPATEGFDVHLSDRQRVWYCEVVFAKHNVNRKRAGGRDDTWSEEMFIAAVDSSLQSPTTAISYNIKEVVEGLSFEIKEKIGDIYRSNTTVCLMEAVQDNALDRILYEIQRTETFAVATAARTGNIESLRQLVSCGADLSALNDGGWNHLQVAADNGQINIVQYLIDNQVDINYTSPDTYTALMCAIRKNHTKVVQLLVESGAKWCYEDSYLHTPIGLALAHKQVDVLRYFCSKDGVAVQRTLQRYGVRSKEKLRTLFQLIYDDKPEYVFDASAYLE